MVNGHIGTQSTYFYIYRPTGYELSFYFIPILFLCQIGLAIKYFVTKNAKVQSKLYIIIFVVSDTGNQMVHETNLPLLKR